MTIQESIEWCQEEITYREREIVLYELLGDGIGANIAKGELNALKSIIEHLERLLDLED